MIGAPTGQRAKSFGAYYTDGRVAAYLAAWATRHAADKVLDPSFGGGVFLEAAAAALNGHGAIDGRNIYGVELDPSVHKAVSRELIDQYAMAPNHLLLADFFAVSPASLPRFDVILGNPPFIRYQSFTDAVREQALARASAQGVELSRLSSSWAPFLVHASGMLKKGGRLGLVLPAELLHAVYARPVLELLRSRFRLVNLITFRMPLFPDLSQDTLLLQAEGYKEDAEEFTLTEVHSLEDLPAGAALPTSRRSLNIGEIARGKERMATAYLREPAKGLYAELGSASHTQRLGDLVSISIGYVSGANRFFHMSPTEAEERGLPRSSLAPSVFRGRALSAPMFTLEDWSAATRLGNAGFLLKVDPQAQLDGALKQYVLGGERNEVNKGYKCRTRTPWYSVPGAIVPDGFITYMSGAAPSFALNSANTTASNTLLAVSFRQPSKEVFASVAVGWSTALTRLSVEIEGHAMGGGMLKLEPREAQRVLVPRPGAGTHEHLEEIDALVRKGQRLAADELADELLLRGRMGLTTQEIQHLNNAALSLRDRRHRKWKEPLLS